MHPMKKVAKQVLRLWQYQLVELGRDPTTRQVGDILGVSRQTVEKTFGGRVVPRYDSLVKHINSWNRLTNSDIDFTVSGSGKVTVFGGFVAEEEAA